MPRDTQQNDNTKPKLWDYRGPLDPSTARVAVLVSGGVDSSVALHLLKHQGFRHIQAFYLKIWLEDDFAFLGDCPWEEDMHFARAVCEPLDIPLQIVSLQQAYHDRVVRHAVAELKAGRTPSPDIHCNQQVKYGAFFEHVQQNFDAIATGHYAQTEWDSQAEVTRMLLSPDPIKDQTYFLSGLSQQQVDKALFPLAPYTKPEVRQLAGMFGLATESRKDSQGICFLGKLKFRDFVREHLGEQPGDIVNIEDRQVLGQHQGYWFHTIGQRKGLGLSGGPWFVVGKDVKRNEILVCHADLEGDLHPASSTGSQFSVETPHWLHKAAFKQALSSQELTVKVRHGAKRYGCTIEVSPLPEEGAEKRPSSRTPSLEVQLDGFDQGLAPGQFAVFYDRQECLGGGVISPRWTYKPTPIKS